MAKFVIQIGTESPTINIGMNRVLTWLAISMLFPAIPFISVSLLESWGRNTSMLSHLSRNIELIGLTPTILMQVDLLVVSIFFLGVMCFRFPLHWRVPSVIALVISYTFIGTYVFYGRLMGGLDRLFFIIPLGPWIERLMYE